MIEYKTTLEGIDWTQAAEVIRQAPLGTREPAKLARAFQNSFAHVAVYDDGRLIGLARAICDGEYQAAIYDVVLLPQYQGKGIGKKMIQELCARLPVPNVILYAAPGREAFYRKLGFRKLLTGMAIMAPDMAKKHLEPNVA